MEVTSVMGQDLAALSVRRTLAAPAPSRRTAETAPNAMQPLPSTGRSAQLARNPWNAQDVTAQSSAAQASAPPNRRQDQGQVLPAAITARNDALPTTAGPRLRVDEASNRVIAEFYDEEGNVIRQLPPEEVLELSSDLDSIEGMFFDQSA